MPITMQHAEHLTPVEIEQFLDAGTTLSFAGTGRKEIYALLERTLRARRYPGLSKKDKGVVRRYLAKISGLSLSQITRLIARWRERGVIEPRASRRRRFPRRYTPDDIARLAAVDAAHEGLSGPAVRRILEREFEVYDKADYQRLASISASHIYNLRRTRAYREHHVHHTKTRAAAVSIWRAAQARSRAVGPVTGRHRAPGHCRRHLLLARLLRLDVQQQPQGRATRRGLGQQQRGRTCSPARRCRVRLTLMAVHQGRAIVRRRTPGLHLGLPHLQAMRRTRRLSRTPACTTPKLAPRR